MTDIAKIAAGQGRAIFPWMSEADIAAAIRAFLAYLENRP
jgi:hypothetical protein